MRRVVLDRMGKNRWYQKRIHHGTQTWMHTKVYCISHHELGPRWESLNHRTTKSPITIWRYDDEWERSPIEIPKVGLSGEAAIFKKEGQNVHEPEGLVVKFSHEPWDHGCCKSVHENGRISVYAAPHPKTVRLRWTKFRGNPKKHESKCLSWRKSDFVIGCISNP